MSAKIYEKNMVLETAIELAKEIGIRKVSIRMIARKLGCSVSPVYDAFDSRDALEKAMFETIIARQNNQGSYFERNNNVLVYGLTYPNLYLDIRKLSNKFKSFDKLYDDTIKLMKLEDPLKSFTEKELESLHFDLMIYITGLVEKSTAEFKDVIDIKEYQEVLKQVTSCFIIGYTHGR